MQSFLKNLNWRYATKSFDPNRPIADEDLGKIFDSIRLAPTSFGLQPFKILRVKKAEIKQKIFSAGWKQQQFITAAEVLVFCTRGDVVDRIHQFMELSANGNPELREKLRGYERVIRGFCEKMTPDELHAWAARQAYIALGFAMAACAELQIDSCPMEGFAPAEIDKALQVPEHLRTSVILTLGYRPADAQVRQKLRFPASEVFEEI